MSSRRALCRLSLCEYGSMWIDARPARGGFSVFVWDNEVVTQPMMLGQRNVRYSWRNFADFLMHLEEGFVVTENLSLIDVEGEECLAADCLRMAWAYREQGGEVLPWLLSQKDEALELLGSQLNILDRESDYEALSELVDLLTIKVEKDLLKLLATYNLATEQGFLEALTHLLEKERDSQLEKKERLTKQALQPFGKRIEKFVKAFDGKPRRIGAGIGGSRPSSRTVVRSWLERYVLEHGYLPDGKHEVSVSFLGGRISEGEIDFSEAFKES